MRLAAELAGLLARRGRHAAQGDGQEGPRAHGPAAREVRPRLQGQQDRRPKAERIWELIEKFAGYGFNKCLTARHHHRDGGRQRRSPSPRSAPAIACSPRTGRGRHARCRPSGVRPVGRLTLANGMSVRCTPDHPIFTQRGWVNAEDVTADDFVAVARALPCGGERVPDHWPALLGYALSEGSLGYAGHFHDTCGAARAAGARPSASRRWSTGGTSGRSPCSSPSCFRAMAASTRPRAPSSMPRRPRGWRSTFAGCS